VVEALEALPRLVEIDEVLEVVEDEEPEDELLEFAVWPAEFTASRKLTTPGSKVKFTETVGVVGDGPVGAVVDDGPVGVVVDDGPIGVVTGVCPIGEIEMVRLDPVLLLTRMLKRATAEWLFA